MLHRADGVAVAGRFLALRNLEKGESAQREVVDAPHCR
jgi:hypothetical protein